MKKILAIILALAAAVCCLTVSVSAAGSFSLKIEADPYTFGSGTLTARVVIDGSVAVNGIDLNIKCPEGLSTTRNDIVWSGEIASADMDNDYLGSKAKNFTDSTVILIFGAVPNDLSIPPVKLSGTIATITFTVDETKITPDSDLTFSFTKNDISDENGKSLTGGTDFDVNPDPEDGKIELTCETHDPELKSDADGHWKECKRCGHKEAKTEHVNSSEHPCIAGKCTGCDYVVPAAEHTPVLKYDENQHWEECSECGTVTKDKENHKGGTATCAEKAKCSVCGTPYGELDKTAHKWEFEKTIEEATCTKEGKAQYKCSVCGETEERTTDKAPHVESEDYKSDGESHWHYCVNCNAVIGNKEAHTPDSDWHYGKSAADGHYHICSVCKAPVGTEDHVDKNSDGTCDVCEAPLHEHIADESKWLSNGEYHYHACKVEGCTVELDVTPHIEDTVWHTEAGSAEHWHICTVCGAKIDKTVAKHSGGEATCTEKAKCADCGAEYGELDKTNHTDGVDETAWESDGTNHWHVCKYCEAKVGVEAHKGGTANCTEQAKCSVCGTAYGELDKTAHKWNDGVVTKEATCMVDGVKTYTCTLCGDTKTEAIKALGHDYDDGKITTPATCLKDGVKTYTCKRNCGQEGATKTEAVKATGHKPAAGYKSDATNHWQICENENCDAEDHIINVTAHTYTAGEYEHDAKGHWQVCTVCKTETEHEEHVKGDMTQDESGHWYKCTSCDEKLEFDAHTKATLTAAVEPYKDDNGVKHDGSLAYWHCPDCGKYFLDNNGKKAGVFDSIDSFTVKYKDDCSDLGHTLTVISSNEFSHTFMCTRECGLVYTEAHVFNERGVCRFCGYKLPGFVETKPDDTVEIDSPVEGTEQGGEGEGDEMNADDIDDTPAEAPSEAEPAPAPAETNPETGLAMSVIPAILAAAALVIKKR